MLGAVVRVDAPDRRPGKITARRVKGVVTALVSLLPCWWLAALAAALAHAAFNGCWLTCGGERNPAHGVFTTIVGALLLVAPFAAGMWVARVRAWAPWASLAVPALLAVIGWIAFSLDPDNTDYFVR